MSWTFLSTARARSNEVLRRFLSMPLQPMELQVMAQGDTSHIHTALEQLTARTARSYCAFSSSVLKCSLDTATAAQLVPLETICKREFECCVALSDMAPLYLRRLGRCEVANVSDPSQSKVHEVDTGCSTSGSGAASPHMSNMNFVQALEDLRPHENLLDIAINEKCIHSPDANHWISRFCRRRVSWRVIHEHLLHLVAPERHPPIIRKHADVGTLLQHAATVVIDLYSHAVQDVHGGSLTITVEEKPHILTTLPTGHLATSSTSVAPKATEGNIPLARSSAAVYSVEGHLEYVFRELIKNACVALMSQSREMELKVYFAMCDTHIVVDVIDQAAGLDPEFPDKLWQFGWSSNTSLCQLISGFGLGLPVSKVYMDLWSGRIDMYTTRDAGTTVRVTFPKAPVEVLLPEGDM
ncbi:putative Histidine kinase DNA gyrase B and HSP90 like ATPase [Trypanosoma vivax]|nr:hypothetical protein TRVL_02609 [Trypanosoma vivax]KAH8614122.1 putative Histidine kinase DNA gyrase B and HSP90 like ATPase [Trypanosoma vivax]